MHAGQASICLAGAETGGRRGGRSVVVSLLDSPTAASSTEQADNLRLHQSQNTRGGLESSGNGTLGVAGRPAASGDCMPYLSQLSHPRQISWLSLIIYESMSVQEKKVGLEVAALK